MEANHNAWFGDTEAKLVAYDIAKIYIWKQITTDFKETLEAVDVAYDIAKIYIWKQITTSPKTL